MEWTVRALVDTGAPVTVFDRGAGDAIGVDFDTPHDLERQYLGGREHIAQIEFVKLRLAPFQDLEWETEVRFLVDDWNMPFGGVLGTRGFLDRWVVTFNVMDDYFVVEEPESFTRRLPPDVVEEFERRDTGFRGP